MIVSNVKRSKSSHIFFSTFRNVRVRRTASVPISWPRRQVRLPLDWRYRSSTCAFHSGWEP